MPYFSLNDINNLEHLYKINLINGCSGFKSANLIGTKSKDGIENVAIFSSVTHVGSNPPILSFFCRPTTVSRDTYENIKETGVYTINHIHESNFEDAHHTSAKYDSSISEFDKTTLISEYKENGFAPFVKDSPIQLEMKFIGEYNIKENGTILVLGEIQGLYINDDIVTEDGFVNLSQAKVAAINGLDGYTFPKLKQRLAYQRPK
ncbi:flavin reductase family protein [Lacinutrix mariniflava]|uniref:flavin reductase family protein n=1 Tax=Lacinutrix mariniflava TaxID=342955 RepID=UPI0006E193A0|nr:flavin reductase family protein [Lacinutrix mariniflava]